MPTCCEHCRTGAEQPVPLSRRDPLVKRGGAKSSADDLGTGRGVVLSRAATILRSIETRPSTGRFVIFF